MKRNNCVIFLLVAVAVLFSSSEAFSAWTQPKGHAYNQMTVSRYETDKKFTSVDANGNAIAIKKNNAEKFVSTKVTYYGEYGVTNDLTVFTSFGWDWQRSADNMNFAGTDGTSGIGDINLGLKQSFIKDLFGTGILMSGQAEVKIPEAYDFGNPLTTLSQGNGQYDATLQVLFGRGFSKGYAWLNTGYQFRFENDEYYQFKPSDVYKLSFGGGYPLTSLITLRGIVEWSKSIGNAEVSDALMTANFAAGGLATNKQAFVVKETMSLEPSSLNVGGSVVLNISKWMPLMKDTFPHKEVVISYNRDMQGFDVFKSTDVSLGETWALAFVFPGEGFFPVNMFK
ncbi:MAG: hypothetical protein ISR96_07200 [Nitrospira sp.]|nr:hypothetical protein [Nitrospira sp.]